MYTSLNFSGIAVRVRKKAHLITLLRIKIVANFSLF